MSLVTYLEALEGSLATGNVLSSVRDNDHRDLVVVPTEELLRPADDVSDNDGGSQRENDVLVVWMENQSFVHLACKKYNELVCVQIWLLKALLASLQSHLPLNPMTADKSSS